LDATAHHIIYVATPTFGARGLYLTIVHALGAKPRAQKADLIPQTQTLLAAEEHERRRRVVVIIDEAQLLAPDQLEELQLLTNAEMDSQSPFALLLVGQPTLARQLRLGVFAALDQRIATRFQLAPMDLAEAAQYLRHHLALVGRTDPLFADDAVARLHKLSLGLPRALKNAAIAALIAAATAGKALFAAMKKAGWCDVRLLGLTDVIGDQDDVPRGTFEQTAAKKLLTGDTWYEEVSESFGKRYLRVATAIPVVSENCVMCHANFKGNKGNVGALSYNMPVLQPE